MTGPQTNGTAQNGSENGTQAAFDDHGVLSVEDLMSGQHRRKDSDTDYVRTVLSTTVAKDYLKRFENEFDPANALSYRDEGYLHEAVTMIRVRTDQYFHENPPPGSKLRGNYRELVYGERREPLSPEGYRIVQAIEQILIARVLMSNDMELQRIIKEMRSEQTRTLEQREPKRSGLRERLTS